jgi:hypothetical protein
MIMIRSYRCIDACQYPEGLLHDEAAQKSYGSIGSICFLYPSRRGIIDIQEGYGIDTTKLLE